MTASSGQHSIRDQIILKEIRQVKTELTKLQEKGVDLTRSYQELKKPSSIQSIMDRVEKYEEFLHQVPFFEPIVAQVFN